VALGDGGRVGSGATVGVGSSVRAGVAVAVGFGVRDCVAVGKGEGEVAKGSAMLGVAEGAIAWEVGGRGPQLARLQAINTTKATKATASR
jgi:hypothetical protein